ncbi:DUF6262 family protein [Rhodococcus pyridinivorans]|uniref:DUF6262 family protein n=1 Tax=Rhodococcus pyridinivorans TaxID=103816 RepID=UPI0039B3B924
MRADNTAHLRSAARQRSARTRHRAETALTDLQARNESITVAGLARAAGVARSWIYTQPDLLEQIHRSHDLAPRRPPPSTVTAASDASWQRRLELAHTRIAELTAEKTRLRHQLALAYGQLRSARITPSKTPSTAQTNSSDAKNTN